MRHTLILAALLALGADPSLAAHANPWATPDDVVNGKNHAENLAQSIDTPGEDEWNGATNRKAPGRLDPTIRDNGAHTNNDVDGYEN